MGNDLIAKGENRMFMGFSPFMDIQRRDFKGIVPISVDFIRGIPGEICPDLKHQHVEMQ
jgi:hypothetical protein